MYTNTQVKGRMGFLTEERSLTNFSVGNEEFTRERRLWTLDQGWLDLECVFADPCSCRFKC